MQHWSKRLTICRPGENTAIRSPASWIPPIPTTCTVCTRLQRCCLVRAGLTQSKTGSAWLARALPPLASCRQPVTSLLHSIISKVKVYLGDDIWSDVQDFPTSSIIFDGRSRAGWMLPAWRGVDPSTMIRTSSKPLNQEESKKKQLLPLHLLQHQLSRHRQLHHRQSHTLWARDSPISASPAPTRIWPASAR